jgi:hypothetical protein
LAGGKCEDTFKTVAMVNEGAKHDDRSKTGDMQQKSINVMAKEMRAANFKMGSVQPEYTLVSPPALVGFRSNQTSINAGSSVVHMDRSKVQGVSEGNPLLKGKTEFITNNMEQLRWIQPTPVAN